jgi:hypothetical protein
MRDGYAVEILTIELDDEVARRERYWGRERY